MRKLYIPLFSLAGALAMGLLWTISQTGLPDTNAHLCDFARRYFPTIPADCQASDWLVSAIGWLFILAVLLFLGSSAWSIATWKGWKRHKAGEPQPPAALQIHFDSTNPFRRFWSLESPRDKGGELLPGIQHEYRVAIFNPTPRTIHGVSVTVESLGTAGPRPFKALFDKTRTETCSLNPGCSELAIVLHWPHPKAQPGMLAGLSALAYGPLLVTASGIDVPPVQRAFWFDYQREPMLFDRPEDVS